jgi:hypothetical protein
MGFIKKCGPFVSLAVPALIAAASLPSAGPAAPLFTYVSGPTGCTQPAGYPDAALCTVPNETPLGTFPLPAVGGTYVDGNFGATVRLISSFSTNHGYSTPSAFSASGKYVALAQNGIQVNVVETATGNVAYVGRPGYVTADTIRWDSYSDDMYYFFRGAQVVRHKLSTNTTTVLVDYSTDGHGFTGISGGGTGDISKDNWIGFWAETEHQVCILDLNKVVTYCADYYGTYPNNRVPVKNVDFVHVSKGVDSISGKRYVLLMSNPAIMVFSVDQTAAKLAYEFRGPEVPTDFQVGSKGNNDGICDVGETCLSGYHSDMVEDSQGRQYLVYVADIESPCQRQITTSMLSAGPKLLISVAQGGGRTDVTPLHLCGGGPIELWAENHTSCARRAPFCAVSTNYTLPRDPADLTTPVKRTTHLSEIMVMRENGAEIRRVAQTRSFQFTNDPYWSFAKASISHDGSAVLWDSNFGYPNRGEAVAMALTSFPVIPLSTPGNGKKVGRALYDLNGDGVINVLDVQIGIHEVLGISPCTNADLIQPGSCTVGDVQQIINVTLGTLTPGP